MQHKLYFEIVPVANIYAGTLNVLGDVPAYYYATGRNRMIVITKLLTYAKLDGYIK